MIVENISEQQKSTVSHPNVMRLKKAESALEYVLKNFKLGEIQFTDFLYLKENERNLLELCEISDDLRTERTVLEESFRVKSLEYEKFLKFQTLLAQFWSVSKPAVAGKNHSCCRNIFAE